MNYSDYETAIANNTHQTYTPEIILFNVRPSWHVLLESMLSTDAGAKILRRINQPRTCQLFPYSHDLFNAFKHFELNDTKVVILGQDPYISLQKVSDTLSIPWAMGLSFSVNTGVNIPPSLNNIYKELIEDHLLPSKPKTGNLIGWAQQGVLLLNSALTVKEGNSNSHATVWEDFTDSIIKQISDKTNNVVFLLMGGNAKAKRSLIDDEKHYIVETVHPSPLAANYNMKGTNKSFFGHHTFTKINNKLIEWNKTPINWSEGLF
jgi:uracil-DNA glycosylase